QCANERAPRPLNAPREPKDKSAEPKGAAEYICGDAAVYKTEKLVTKRGDAASRALRFATPPNAECWMTEGPKAEGGAAPGGRDTDAAPSGRGSAEPAGSSSA